MLLVIAGLALALSTIGIFSVVAYSVARKLRDFGIRIALGATPWRILRHVLLEAAQLSMTGAVLGLLCSLWATHLLSGLLYGVEPGAPLPLIAASMLLVVVSIVASALAAVRAIRADPVATIRAE